MQLTFALFIFGFAVQSIRGDCWWTGCQPNNWAVVGCAQYGRDEQGRESCSAGAPGNKYNCCTKESGGGGGGSTGGGGSSGGAFVSFDQFSRAVTSNGYPSPSQEQYNNFNKYGRSIGKISTVQEAAMALAQLLHESMGFTAKREIRCKDTQCRGEYRYPGCDASGQFYYGRGYIQLTWCYNYRDASAAIFGDNRLILDPDEVARNDAVAWQTTFWFWGNRVHGKDGVQQEKFGATTKAINGGLECSWPGNAQAQHRFALYGKVRSAFGLPGNGDSSGCA